MLRFIYWGDEVAAELGKKHPRASLFWKIAHLAGLISLSAITLAVLLTGYANILGFYSAAAGGAVFVLPQPALWLFLASSITLAVYCFSLGIAALLLGEPLWAAGCFVGCITILPLWPISAAFQYLKGKEILGNALRPHNRAKSGR